MVARQVAFHDRRLRGVAPLGDALIGPGPGGLGSV
jgi:hypothetical protein